MFKARKQANNRKKTALFFYSLTIISVFLILMGVLSFEPLSSGRSSDAMALKLSVYIIPFVFVLFGIFFHILSKIKASQATAFDMRGSNWQF